jgi:hypothetical protein
MASNLENIQLGLPGFYNKYDSKSVLYTVISACVDMDERRAVIIKRIDSAIGIDTTYDEDLEYRWGSLLSMPKNRNETYTAYRNRLKMAYPSLIGGTADAIKYAIASVIGISNDQTLVDDYIVVMDAWEQYDGINVDVQSGTSIYSSKTSDSMAELNIEGVTVVTPANPGLPIAPDNPATIVSAGDVVYDIIACGKNVAQSVTYAIGSQYNVSVYFKSDMLRPNTTYVFSIIIPAGESYYANENMFTSTAYVSGDGTRKILILTTKSNLDKSNAYMYNSSYGWILFKNSVGCSSSGNASNLQVEPGSVETIYEAYESNRITIPSTYPTRSLPNGKRDYLIPTTGDVLKHVKILNKVVLTSSSNLTWYYNDTANQRIRLTFRDLAGVQGTAVTCDRFSGIVIETSGGVYFPGVLWSVFGITSSDTDAAAVAKVRSWLDAHPTTVIYELATPVETVTDIPSYLISYKGVTNISSTAPVQPMLTASFKDDMYNTIHTIPSEYKAYGHIICAIDLSVGQDAFDIEQEIIDSINRVKASGIQPHILYSNFKVFTYAEMSRFDYSTLGGVNYSDLG